MKRLLPITVTLLFISISVAYAQEQNMEKKPVKNDQAGLVNDIYISYGLGSLYYISNSSSSTENYRTSGAVQLGFARSLGKVIAVGFQAGYMSITHSQSTTNYYENYWQGMANVRFRYYNRPSFCMYSGVAVGIAVDYYRQTKSTGETTMQKYYPAGQFTLLGFRVGRAFSFYGEFGIGTNAIINMGFSYKFGD
jgi:hypothetical protein